MADITQPMMTIPQMPVLPPVPIIAAPVVRPTPPPPAPPVPKIIVKNEPPVQQIIPQIKREDLVQREIAASQVIEAFIESRRSVKILFKKLHKIISKKI